MGLLMYRERVADDKTPFRKNEWYTGKLPRPELSVKSSLEAGNAQASRSPIRRDRLERSNARRRSILDRMNTPPARFARPDATGTSRSGGLMMEHINSELADRARAAEIEALPPLERSARSAHDEERHDRTERDRAIRQRMIERDQTRPRTAAAAALRDSTEATRTNLGISTQFAPAHRYYEDLRREQHFEVLRARGRAHTSADRRDSHGEVDSWTERVASPDTTQAIFQELARQDDGESRSRRHVESQADIDDRRTSMIPRMTMSRSDGLGDRQRSPSQDREGQSDTEENWTSFMETIPVDGDVPRESSSFASDGASSILSRSRPRSTVTNSTSLDSRSASTEAAQTRDTSGSCPDPTGHSAPTSPQPSFLEPRVSSLIPVRYTETGITRAAVASRRSDEDRDDNHESSEQYYASLRNYENLDPLMDRLDSGQEIPPEMWAAVGITPHLGLRGGAGRLRRRNEHI